MSKDAVPVGDVRISILAHKIFDSGCYWEKRKHEQQLMEELVVCPLGFKFLCIYMYVPLGILISLYRNLECYYANHFSDYTLQYCVFQFDNFTQNDLPLRVGWYNCLPYTCPSFNSCVRRCARQWRKLFMWLWEAWMT